MKESDCFAHLNPAHQTAFYSSCIDKSTSREFKNGSPGVVKGDQLLGLEDRSLRVTAAALHVAANPEKHPRLRLMLADLSEVMHCCEEEQEPCFAIQRLAAGQTFLNN